MIDSELDKRLRTLEEKLDATYRSAERMRKMFMWTLIITAITIIVPLIGLLFVIPAYLNSLDFGGLL